MAHTKGPWKAGPYSSIVGCPISAQPDPKKNTTIVAGARGASPDERGAFRAEVEANAHLIAAAPGLLEELEEATKDLVVVAVNIRTEMARDEHAKWAWENVPEIIDKRVSKARDAITKARGNQ